MSEIKRNIDAELEALADVNDDLDQKLNGDRKVKDEKEYYETVLSAKEKLSGSPELSHKVSEDLLNDPEIASLGLSDEDALAYKSIKDLLEDSTSESDKIRVQELIAVENRKMEVALEKRNRLLIKQKINNDWEKIIVPLHIKYITESGEKFTTTTWLSRIGIRDFKTTETKVKMNVIGATLQRLKNKLEGRDTVRVYGVLGGGKNIEYSKRDSEFKNEVISSLENYPTKEALNKWQKFIDEVIIKSGAYLDSLISKRLRE